MQDDTKDKSIIDDYIASEIKVLRDEVKDLSNQISSLIKIQLDQKL